VIVIVSDKQQEKPWTDKSGVNAKTVLHVEGLSKAFGGQLVLDELCLTLHRGEVVLLRGDNGSGKTTLLNVLTGNLEPDEGRIQLVANGTEENFRFPKRWWQQLNPFDHFTPERVAEEGVGRTWQEIRLFPTQSLRDNIAVAAPRQHGENPLSLLLRPFSVRRQERKGFKDADELLKQVGLEGRENSSADMVSLAQAKRVAILRALQAGAQILFLDEPLSGLDAAGVIEVMALLRDLVRERAVTLVIVEHVLNIPRILDLSTKVWTLRSGKLVVEHPDKAREQMGHAIDNRICDWLRSMATPSSEIDTQQFPGGATLSEIDHADANGSDLVLEVHDLIVYRGKRLVIGERKGNGEVRGLSFTLREGQVGLLEAPNGWGKTTLLEAVAGLIPAAKGEIKIRGRDVSTTPPWRRAELGLSFLQARNNVFPTLTVQESLQLSGIDHIPRNLEQLRSRRMAELSGGEKQKVAAACALNGASRLGLLDEPFSALDQNSLNDVKRAIVDCSQHAALLVAVPRGLGVGDVGDCITGDKS
jgi:ABC-type branched-subunit amino acid transport system ATPase component